MEPAVVTPESSPAPAAAGSAAHDKAITSGVMWQGALRWLSQVLSWSATIVIARRLSAEDYGIAGTATVLVGLLSLVTEGGLGRAIMMRRDRDEVVVEQSHGAAIMTGFAAAIVMLLAAYPVSRFYSEPRVLPVVAALSLALIFSGMNAIPLAVMQQQLQYKRLAAVEFGKAIVQAVTVLLCAHARIPVLVARDRADRRAPDGHTVVPAVCVGQSQNAASAAARSDGGVCPASRGGLAGMVRVFQR